VLLGVQHVVRELFLLSAFASSSEFSIDVVPTSTGWPRAWQSLMSATIGVDLLLERAEDEVVLVLADHRLVRRDHHRLEVVDLLELEGLGVRGSRHAGELAVHPEVVLERDRRERLVLALDGTPSFASTAWCRPSDQRRPDMRRPVNSSTMITSPFCTT
jgi:hypothetical protein